MTAALRRSKRKGSKRGGFVGGLIRLAARLLLVVAAFCVLAIVAYRWVDPPVTPLMLIRLTEESGIDYRPVPLEQIAPVLAQAVISAEDNLFCRHNGIDWGAVGDAIEEYADGDRLRGASTITMQTARNLFLWPGGSFLRKGVEAAIALTLELFLPKRRTLEIYLNIVEWGHGVYGAEAAARHHFGKSAARLTRREASLLAAVLPNPRTRDAGKPSDFVSGRASAIANRIGKLGPLLDCSR